MKVTIKEVKSRKDLKKFIYLPEKIHADHETWVHPIYMDEWTYFDAKKNKAFSPLDQSCVFFIYLILHDKNQTIS